MNKNRLWFRARAIDADVVNENGDIFPKDEVVASYLTFVGCPITTNYCDIEPNKGEITEAEWDEENKCVYVKAYVDLDKYPHIGRGIIEGYIKDVGMSCFVDQCDCSVCGNKATKESELCEHVRESKGRNSVYETNFGLNFKALSLVSDGAFENCKIEEILEDPETSEK